MIGRFLDWLFPRRKWKQRTVVTLRVKASDVVDPCEECQGSGSRPCSYRTDALEEPCPVCGGSGCAA